MAGLACVRSRRPSLVIQPATQLGHSLHLDPPLLLCETYQLGRAQARTPLQRPATPPGLNWLDAPALAPFFHGCWQNSSARRLGSPVRYSDPSSVSAVSEPGTGTNVRAHASRTNPLFWRLVVDTPLTCVALRPRTFTLEPDRSRLRSSYPPCVIVGPLRMCY